MSFVRTGKTKSTQLRTRWRVPSKYLGIMRTAVSMLKPGLSIYSQSIRLENFVTVMAPVIQMADNTMHWINFYPADNAIVSPNAYPLHCDLSGG